MQQIQLIDIVLLIQFVYIVFQIHHKYNTNPIKLVGNYRIDNTLYTRHILDELYIVHYKQLINTHY